ncbi:MAG TPA: helicase-associated domain-containing protein [Mycobacteriales bacterium]|nr:helicase-associated domain-containing protein [Mycobacteriales bacterium]
MTGARDRSEGRLAARSLAAWLRAWTDQELADLVRDRPDLVVPVPTDISVLATRAAERTHVARAVDGLDQFTLAVLEAVLLLEPPVTPAAVAGLIGAVPTAALDRLRGLALVWGESALRPVGGLALVLERPAGLGRPAKTLLRRTDRSLVAGMLAAHGLPGTADPDEAAARLAHALPQAIAAADPAEQAVLRRVDETGGVGGVAGALIPAAPDDPSPVRRLMARGLLIPVDLETVELPREVGTVLRGAQLLPSVPITPPPLQLAGNSRRDVDAAGALAAAEAVRLVERLAEHWSAHPPAELKSGGLGQRELRAVAKYLAVDERTAGLLLETARAADLLGRTTALDGGFAPTGSYDGWARQPVPDRWATLALGWLAMPVHPTFIGERDDRDRPVAALSGGAWYPPIRELRRTILRVLADAPAGGAPTAESRQARLDWLAPRRPAFLRADRTAEIMLEAAALGLTVGGALAGYARLLLTGQEPAAAAAPVAAALAKALPAPVDHLLLQADLTAIAPGPLEPELARSVLALADVESPGSATVYRFSETSLRRALDAGWDAASVHQLLARIGRPSVPQALSYLIDDIARRHGQLRAGSASGYVRSDDEALLAEVVADRRCAPLRLRRIAPTVVVSSATVTALVDGLRAAGYSPVAERPDGTVVLGRAEGTRAARSLTLPVADNTGPDERTAARIVASLRAGDRAASHLGGVPAGDRGVSATLALLEQAMSEGRPVLLGYINAQGQDSRRIVEPERVGGGLLTAYDQKTQERRSFALHRITEAILLADDA